MTGDQTLIQIVDAALAEATRKAGPWLACRPGCFECCYGPFGISHTDAARLREGLEAIEPDRAERIRRRASESAARLTGEYPGDTLTRVLEEDEAGEDEPCPALDPATGTCDLYAWRPITCRTFGPPLRYGGDEVAICDLCFEGAAPEEIAACAVDIDVDVEPSETLIAFALALPDRSE